MKAIDFLNGTFGKRRLSEPYRTYWQVLCWGIIGGLFLRLFIEFLEIWERVVDFINYVIW